ncbi:YadA-like family protein [Pasteurella sp. PK-2025]|uniref:YadA-like family protein n=1 Tax=Pasteurella sp. PK-2025 TaxID=3413133 RepID=UPI003C732544
MNQIYKVIWSHTLNTFVVVSELAKGYAKSSSNSNSHNINLSTSKFTPIFKLTALSLVLGASLSANAYVAIDNAENGLVRQGTANATPSRGEAGTHPFDYFNPGNKSYTDRNQPGPYSYKNQEVYDDRTAFGIAIGKHSNAIKPNPDRYGSKNPSNSNGIAIGDYSRATGGLAIALGSFSHATDVGGVALGTSARADGFNSLSVMRQSAAIGDYSAAIGSVAWANGTASLALGASATTFGNQSIAIGSVSPQTLPADAGGGIPTKKTKYDGLNRTQTNGDNSIAMGTGAKTNGHNSFAIGSGAETGEFVVRHDTYLNEYITEANKTKSAQGAIALGVKAKARANQSAAFGENALANASSAMAFGSNSSATGVDAIAVGVQAKALRDDSIAFGYNANASYVKAISIGSNSIANNENTTAIGVSAKATHKDSVALGTNSITDQVHKTANYTVNGHTHHFAGADPIGTVSVGGNGKVRTITNVGAGRISNTSTDAINGSQLYAVAAEVGKGWTLTTGKENGGEATGTSNQNVKLGDTVTVKAGKNIKVHQAGSTITVATQENVSFNHVNAAHLNVTGTANVKDLAASGNTTVNHFTVKQGGNINMGGNRVTNIGTPTHDSDATTKKYVDDGRTVVKSTDNSVTINTTTVNGAKVYDLKVRVQGQAVPAGEFKYKGDNNQVVSTSLSTPVHFKGTADEITTEAQNGSVTFKLAEKAKKSLEKADSAVQDFTVGSGNGANGNKITVNKNNKHFDIAGTADYVTTAITGNKLTVGLGQKAKEAIDGVTSNTIKVTGGNTQANSFAVKNGGDIKVVAKKNNSDIIEVGADTALKAITVGINQTNFDNAVTNNRQVQENKNKLTTLTAKVTQNTQQIENGWELQVNGSKVKDVKPTDRKANFKAGDNIVLSNDGSAVKIATSLTPTFTDATFGTNGDKTVINKDGITISNGNQQVSLTQDGLNNGGKKITNVARGVHDSDAVTVAQLNEIKAKAGNGWTLKVNNQNSSTVLADSPVSLNDGADNNIKVVKNANDNNVSFTLNPSVTLGKVSNGADGVDGALTVNGKGGAAVALNGADGSISLTGVAQNGAKPQTTVKVAKGPAGVEGGNQKTRLTHTSENNQVEYVATLNDGLKFKGDDNAVISKKLNEQLELVGGADHTKLSDRNIGVKSNNGKLEIKLAKELANLTSAEFGAGNDRTTLNKDGIVIHHAIANKQVTLSENGLNNGGSQIVNVASGLGKNKDLSTITVNDKEYTNAANIGDLKTAIDHVTNAGAKGGFGLVDADGQEVKQNLGTAIKVQGKDGVRAKVVDTVNGKKALEIGLNSTVSIGKNNEPGQLTLKGQDGANAITLNGKDGSIGLKGENGINATIKVGNGPSTLDGNTGENQTPRMSYTNKGKTEYVATTNDGLQFGANAGAVHKAKLNSKVDIKGANSNQDWNKFDQGTNLMTQINGSTVNIALAKDLTALNSATFTKPANAQNVAVTTKVEGNGLTITPAAGNNAQAVTLTDKGLNNGNNQITHVASGLMKNGQVVELSAAEGDTLKNAVNVQDLKNAINASVGNSSWNLKVNNGETKKVGNNETVEFVNGDNIEITNTDKKIKVSTKSDLNVNTLTAGKPNKNGQDGIDGAVTAQGKDGSAVALNGKDGSISLASKGQNGKDASANIKVKQGQPDVNGQPSEKKTRITYQPVAADGQNQGEAEEVATLKDGLKFKGDKGTEVVKQLNQTLSIKGNVAETAEVTDKNLRVDAEGDGLVLKMAKSLKELKDATFGVENSDDKSVINKDGLTITEGGKTVSLTQDGLNNGGNKVTNVASGLDGKTLSQLGDNAPELTNGANIKDLKAAITEVTSAGNLGGFGLKDDKGVEVKQNLGKSIAIKGDGSITTTVIDTNGEKSLKVGLTNHVSVGDTTQPGTITVKGDANKDAIVLNGKDGSIGLNGKDGAKADITVANGPSKLGGAENQNDTPRISYTPEGSNTPEFVATMNDGLTFAANSGEHNAKLNSKVSIKGHQDNADWAKFDAGKNIMTHLENGSVTVGLAKDVTDLSSVTFNQGQNGATPTATTKVGTNGITITPKANNGHAAAEPVSLTDKGLNNGGNKVVNVASGLDGKNLSELADGATELTNAANIGDLKTAVDNIAGAAKGGFGLKDQNGQEFKQALGETAQIKGDGSVVTKVVDTANGGKALEVSLNKDVTIGNNNEAGTIKVKGENGKDGISLNGKDGSIGLNGKDGASANITVANGKPDVNGAEGAKKQRITYQPVGANGAKVGEPEEVATLNDGLKFQGNNGETIVKKLNETLAIKGKLDQNAEVTAQNLRVDNENGELVLKMAKSLKDLNDVTLGAEGDKAVINKDGITFTNNDPAKTVSLTDTGLNNGGNKITHLAAGEVSANSTDAVNGSQLHAVKEAANAGWNLSVNDANPTNVKPTNTVDLSNSDSNIVIAKTEENGKHKVDFKLNDNLSVKNAVIVGPKGQDGQAAEGAVIVGKDGRNGKDGANGIALVGKDGKDAVAIKAKDGVGAIGLTGAAGKDGKNTSAELSIAEGQKGLDANDRQNGENKTRIVYTKPDNTKEEVATLNDGLVFEGNDGTSINRKLNSKLRIIGGITDKADLATDSTNVSSANLGVRSNGADGLEIVMKERPTFSGLALNGKDGKDASIEFKGANGEAGMSIAGKNGADGKPSLVIKGKDGADGVTFTDDGRIANVAEGKDGKDAVNVTQLDKVKNDIVTKGFGIKAEDGTIVNKALGEAVDVVGDGTNISTKVVDGKVKVELAKDVNLGADGSLTTGKTVVNNDGVKVGDTVKLADNGLTVNDKIALTTDGLKVGDVNITEAGINAGNHKITKVANGDISATSTDAVNGSQLFAEVAKAKTDVVAGENMEVTSATGANGQTVYTVATKKDVAFNNVKVGDIAIHKDTGIHAGNKKVTNVADGDIAAGSLDAVNGGQLFTEVAKAKTEVKAGTNIASVTAETGDKGQTIYTVNAETSSVSAGSDKVTVIKAVKDANNVTDYKVDLAQATKDDIAKGVDAKAQVDKGFSIADGSGKAKNYKLGETVTIEGDNNLTTETTAKGVKVKLNPDVNVNSVTAKTFRAGDVVVSADTGINAGGKQITNVASGLVDRNGKKVNLRQATGDTLNNAVNVGDLKNVAGDIYNNIDAVNNRVNKLDKRVRGIGANAAAAASLPQVYIPGKSMVAASAGGYSGASAIAVGYSRASDNGKVILKLTGTANSAGHYSGGVGVGYQW